VNKIKSILPLAAFLLFLGKNMVLPPSFPDAIILASLVTYIILESLRLENKEFKKLEEKLQSMAQLAEKQQQDMKNIQSAISSIKLSSGLRTINQKNG
jgi:hypothetical protein